MKETKKSFIKRKKDENKPGIRLIEVRELSDLRLVKQKTMQPELSILMMNSKKFSIINMKYAKQPKSCFPMYSPTGKELTK